MGYSICKEGKNGFRILWEVQENGVKEKRHVKKTEWSNLGFSSCKTIEEAKHVANGLNANIKILADEKRRNRLEERRQKDNLKDCAHLPKYFVDEFEKSVVAAKNLRIEHWETAKKAIREVNIPSSDWYFFSHKFFNYFESCGYSPDYSNRIRRLLNEWGRFLCYKTKTFWESIPAPRGKFANRIRESYERKTKGGRYRARLSFELLESKKHELKLEEYHWLYISVAFGLRPEEVTKSLKTSGKWGIKENSLFIYQYKLERCEPKSNRRWKKIDFVLPEQEKAKDMILSGVFEFPSRKKLKKLFGEKMTYYGGRKQFFPFMKKKFDAYTVATWMGHKSLETAKRNYDAPEDDMLPKELDAA